MMICRFLGGILRSSWQLITSAVNYQAEHGIRASGSTNHHVRGLSLNHFILTKANPFRAYHALRTVYMSANGLKMILFFFVLDYVCYFKLASLMKK